MFNPSDILYIILAFCALWITAFVCWLIWQVARIIKNVNNVMREARETMGKIEGALNAIRQKFETVSGTAAVFAEGIKKIVDYAIDRRGEKKEEEMEGSKEEVVKEEKEDGKKKGKGKK